MNGKLKAALALTLVLGIGFGLYSIVAQKSPAPEVTLVTLQGEKLALADLRGKVVLVNFWATSCSTCIQEMPALIATQQKYAAQDFVTVAIAMNYDTPDFISAYVQKNKLPFSVAHDASGKAAAAFGDIRLTPTTFIIDRQGRISKRILGAPDFPALHQLIDSLLQNI